MDDATILRLLDVERQTVADTGVTLERTPCVVRAIGLESSWNGIVYSRFSPSETETIVNAEIQYFTQDFLLVESAIWSCEPSKTREHLLSTLSDPWQRDLGFVAYSDRKPIGFGRVTASPHSQFSGLWGGSVLPDFRGPGVYRALLSARIQHVLQYDSTRYLRVDALPTSRPILEKYGFKVVASTWPAEWPPAPVKC